MAQKTKIKLESRFPVVKEAAYEVVQEAREAALEVGKTVAQQRWDTQAEQRGYDINAITIEEEHLGFQSGRIYADAESERHGADPFWERWFEYGTAQIPAMPFMRPGARAMRKTFIGIMGAHFDGWVRRRVRL